MAEEKDRWKPSKLIQSMACSRAPRLSGILCRAGVLCCGSGLPATRNGYGAAGSRFDQEVVELEETPWQIAEEDGGNTVMVTLNGKDNKFLGNLLHLGNSPMEERWEVYKTLKKFQNKLKFEYLVPIKDVVYDRQKDRLIVITDYCEGGSVQSVLAHARRYDEMLNDVEVQDWLVQLLLALEHLEEQNMIHGQINCQEILLKDNAIRLQEPAELKRIYRRYARQSSSGSQGVPSTTDFQINYVAPEILTGDTYTAKSDVWSVGCVLYELCTKKRLFSGSSAEELKTNITTGKNHRLPTLFPYELQEVLNILLTTDPIYRPGPSAALQLPYIQEHLEDMEMSNNIPLSPITVTALEGGNSFKAFVQSSQPARLELEDDLNNNQPADEDSEQVDMEVE